MSASIDDTDPPVEVIVEDTAWLEALPDFEAVASQGAAMALRAVDLDPRRFEIAVLACDDARIAALNADHRGKSVATNVLSWPAFELIPHDPGGLPDPPPEPPVGERLALGDVAIARETCISQAKAAQIPLKSHATHLILHSVLHLLGYDHQTDEDAQTMEGLESRAMLAAGFSDPYRDERDGPA